MTLPPHVQRIRDEQIARLRANPDGTTVSRDPARAGVADLAVPANPLVSGLSGYVDDYTAAQLGLVTILDGLTFAVVDVAALLEGRVEVGQMRFDGRIFLDHPDPEDSRIPTPSATITEGGPPEYTLPGALSGATYLEGTEGVWGEGTILRRAYTAIYQLQVVCWLAHKDDRAAVRKGLVGAFYAEPGDGRSDRRITLPWYYDRPVRYSLTGISYPDTQESAVAGTWPLVADIRTEITGAELVPAPGYLLEPQIRVSAT